MNIQVLPYLDRHFDGVNALWREAFPDDAPRNTAKVAIPIKLAIQPDLLLVAIDGEDVVGSMPDSVLKPVVILASARSHGETRRTVEIAFPIEAVELIDLSEHHIGGYDYAHSNAGDSFLSIVDRMLSAKAIVFATPAAEHRFGSKKALGYLSLPESFIAEPHEFLSYFHEHMGRDDDEVAKQAYSIIDNISYIQLPCRTGETSRVIQSFDPPRPFYFKIVQLNQIEQEMPRIADTWSCSRYVDLLTPYLQGVNAFELKQTVNCLVDEIEGKKGASWDRGACEKYFNDRRNFLPMQLRKPNKLDWRA